MSDATFYIICEPEYARIEGNCSAIDPETDRETENYIRAELEAGNEWAWCIVTVFCEIEHNDETFEGLASLGACSYLSEVDFKDPDGYYQSLCAEAFERCVSQIENT